MTLTHMHISELLLFVTFRPVIIAEHHRCNKSLSARLVLTHRVSERATAKLAWLHVKKTRPGLFEDLYRARILESNFATTSNVPPHRFGGV